MDEELQDFKGNVLSYLSSIQTILLSIESKVHPFPGREDKLKQKDEMIKFYQERLHSLIDNSSYRMTYLQDELNQLKEKVNKKSEKKSNSSKSTRKKSTTGQHKVSSP